jgi:FAD/FMN-containing dehydrogenase
MDGLYTNSGPGLGADNMINAQVVLANGSIVDANAKENPELWKALKGGGFNTGIVTRYDLTAFSAVNISYGEQTQTQPMDTA